MDLISFVKALCHLMVSKVDTFCFQVMISAERNGYCPDYCARSELRHKAVQEIRRLRRQLAGEVRQVIPGDTHHLDTELQHLSPPDQVQARLLQQLLLAGSPWQVARRISEQEEKEAKENRGGYRTGAMEQLGEYG